ncbi:MAG: hypothetical protein JWR89_4884 [Tardiphaga sp.]|nr:hypothetical protein [Tardiphaga sp.]
MDAEFVGDTEIGLTRTLTLLALGCLLVVGASVAAIVGRDSVPTAPYDAVAQNSIEVARGPVSNKQGKKDRLPVGALLASLEPPPAALSEPLRRAFASDSPVAGPGNTVLAPIEIPSQSPGKPKLAAKPPVQKNYTLLSDAQIAAIKGRLNLTVSQQQQWPAVEDALRAVARKMHDTKQANPKAGSPPIDPASAEVQQLKSAAMPLLFTLREDQKREVRSLARIIGLESVASAI